MLKIHYIRVYSRKMKTMKVSALNMNIVLSCSKTHDYKEIQEQIDKKDNFVE